MGGAAGRRRFGKHVLTYSPGYAPEEIAELAEISDHLDFNSLTQWSRFREEVMRHPRFLSGELKCGLRVNPRFSTGHTPLYDPCAPGSRLGVTPDVMQGADLAGISGLHFHTLCEQGADDLAATLGAVERHFGHILSRPEMTWLNMAGAIGLPSPAMTGSCWRSSSAAFASATGWRSGWSRERPQPFIPACCMVQGAGYFFLGRGGARRSGCFRVRPHAGYAGNALPPGRIPDCPGRPPSVPRGSRRADGRGELRAGGERREGSHTYRLGAPTCLAGDRIGDYSFAEPLAAGDELVFDDMAHYTMVKTTFFNGVRHPDIAVQRKDGSVETVRRFTYEDFEARLG